MRPPLPRQGSLDHLERLGVGLAFFLERCDELIEQPLEPLDSPGRTHLVFAHALTSAPAAARARSARAVASSFAAALSAVPSLRSHHGMVCTKNGATFR